jgi:hypothetical protein
MLSDRRAWPYGWAGVLLVCAAATAVQADFYLVQRIDLGDHFGPLGNNPMTLASDGTYAYIGGYSASVDPRDVGILKISLTDPNDATALAGGTQTVNQFRYYGGLVVRDGVLYALCDRPDDATPSTNVRAIDVATGELVETFDGDFGDGNGIVYEPAGMIVGATGGLAFDPGYQGGGDSGLSLLGYGSGRRVLLDINDGITLYDTSDGMIVADNDTMGCTVADKTAWRDQVYDADGNVYLRRSNQVQEAIRSGPNTIGGYAHLTDELNDDGTPREGCGDGRPVGTRVAPYIVGQNLELIPASSAGTDQDLIIFNDRWSTFSGGDRPFADTIKLITTSGDLPDPPVQLLDADGGPLDPNSVVPDGVGLYDFYYVADQDALLLLDFANRSLLVFGVAALCPGDVDGDGDTDLSDLAELLTAYGSLVGDPNYNPAADFDQDDDVDLTDLAFLLADYGCGARRE